MLLYNTVHSFRNVWGASRELMTDCEELLVYTWWDLKSYLMKIKFEFVSILDQQDCASIQYLTIHFLFCGDSPHIFQRSVHFFMTYYLTISSFSKTLKRCDCYAVCCFQNVIFYLWPYHKNLWPTAVWEKNHIVQHVIETSWWWNCKIILEIHIKLESLTLYLLSNLSINSRSPNDILSFFLSY